MTNQKIPPKPDVEQPPSWTWATQQLVAHATSEAEGYLYEEAAAAVGGEVLRPGWARMALENEIDRRILVEPDLRREFYERTVYFINKSTPRDGASRYGLPVDRAHARLRVWLKLFGNL